MIRRLILAPLLYRLALDRPARHIDSAGNEYLYRIFLAERDGTRYYLHWFAGIDADRHTHSHPFDGLSIILCGAYREEITDILRHELYRLTNRDVELATTVHTRRLWNRIPVDRYHRIVDAKRSTWTLFVAGPHRAPWFFARTNAETTRLEFTAAESADARWWESAPTLRELLAKKSARR